MPMRTYIPVFVKDIFHRGPETYGNLLALMGLGSICGSLTIAGAGQCPRTRDAWPSARSSVWALEFGLCPFEVAAR